MIFIRVICDCAFIDNSISQRYMRCNLLDTCNKIKTFLSFTSLVLSYFENYLLLGLSWNSVPVIECQHCISWSAIRKYKNHFLWSPFHGEYFFRISRNKMVSFSSPFIKLKYKYRVQRSYLLREVYFKTNTDFNFLDLKLQISNVYVSKDTDITFF
jgi:hypothetical protein